MNLRILYYISILLFLFVIKTNGQNRSFSFQHYGPEEGLSNANVFAIKQDINNILYLATQNGVYDFDGYNFTKLKPKKSLKSNDIRNIGFNLNSKLIIINRREGIYEYDKSSNTATLLKDIAFKTSVDELIFDTDYNYALNEQISISAIEIRTGKIIEDEIKNRDKFNQAYALFKTSNLTILVGRTDGLYQYKNGRQLKLNLGKSFPVYSITQDESGTIYLGTDNAIIKVKDNIVIQKIQVKTPQKFSFFGENNNSKVSKIVVDKYNRIWFTNNPDDNLYLIENNITYDAFDLLGIDRVLINCIYKDTEDHIWIGTFNDGVYFIQNPALQNISFTSGRKILPVSRTSFIENSVVVGTNNGLFIYDYEHNNTQTVIEPDNLFLETVYGIHPNQQTVIYSKINSMSNDKQSFLINNHHYNFLPIASKLFSYCENPNEAYLADGVGTLLKIKDYTTKKYTILDTIFSFSDYRTRINTLFSRNNALYIGTSEGLTIYDITSKKIKKYSSEIFSFGINGIVNHSNKTYIAHENGITILEDSIHIQQIGEQHLTAVKKIKFYQNKIWIATLDGLFICDEKFNPLLIYNKSNGLQSNTINDIEFNDSICCISSDKGITLCRISNLFKQVHKSSKLFITSVNIDEKMAELNNNSIILSSSQSDVTINFLSPLFVKPNKQYYKYKYDNGKWANLENTQIHLTSIEGGEHFIELTSSYDNINWSESIKITVKKDIPFKETIWFILSITFGLLVLIGVLAYIWLRRIRINTTKKVQEERQVNLLKHQAMNSLMSPHFIFNSLTSIQNYINLNDSLKASEYLAKFSRLIRMIIEKAAQSEILLNEELTRLNYYLDLEKERFKGKFDFFITVDENIDTLKIKIPNMIIQPYAENSIIHGILPKHEHGNLYIKFKKDGEKTLLIIIEDDGIGYNKAKENIKTGHKSLGTKTIENILELNSKLTEKKQSVEIIDKLDLPDPEQGTRITITLQID